MAKQGMKRPEQTKSRQEKTVPPIPELQGKSKRGKEKAGKKGFGTEQADRFQTPAAPVYPFTPEPSIPSVYPVIDTDLGRDNVENDLTAADRQDF